MRSLILILAVSIPLAGCGTAGIALSAAKTCGLDASESTPLTEAQNQCMSFEAGRVLLRQLPEADIEKTARLVAAKEPMHGPADLSPSDCVMLVMNMDKDPNNKRKFKPSCNAVTRGMLFELPNLRPELVNQAMVSEYIILNLPSGSEVGE